MRGVLDFVIMRTVYVEVICGHALVSSFFAAWGAQGSDAVRS